VKKTAFEGEVAYFSQHFYKPRHVIQRQIPRGCPVVLQSCQGHLSGGIKGEEVAKDYVPEWNPARTPNGQVGFGGYIDDNVFRLRYREVTLRRLTAPPSPPATPRP
jgi:hypothetical protein